MHKDPARWPRTVPEVLAAPLVATPDKEAFVSATDRLSYRQLDLQIEKAAAALHACGIARGDRVAASLPNSTDIIVAFHAAQRLGAVWVGINRLLAAPEKEYILEHSGAKLLLAEPPIIAQLQGRLAPELRVVAITGRGGEGDEWRGLLAAAGSAPARPEIAPEDPAGIAYTSGTTGRPKGVVHSHHNLIVAAAMQIATRPGYGPELRKVDMFAATIINVMVVTAVMIPMAGATSILVDSSNAQTIVECIRREQANCYQGVPPILYSMVNDPAITPAHLASLTEVITGGAPTPELLLWGFREKFGLSIVGTYGQTEAPAMLVMEARNGSDHVPGANGRAMPHVELFAEAEGRRLGANEIGEICVSPVREGPYAGLYTTMLEYWKNPQATAEVLRGGHLHTGDIGYLDETGRLFIVDRKNAMIIRGGANVYPAEVERVLAADARVADSAVFSLPDERLGERVVAAVQLAAGAKVGEEELREICLAQLARYKVPERFLFVDKFPRNAMNKIIRGELRPLFGSRLSLDGTRPTAA